MKKLLVSVCCLAGLLLSGCGKEIHTKEKFTNVLAVFYNSDGSYSFLVHGESNTIVSHEFPWNTKYKVLDDIAPNEPMWAEVCKDGNPESRISIKVEIHIHSVNDLSGGSWDRGKFGKGSLNRISP